MYICIMDECLYVCMALHACMYAYICMYACMDRMMLVCRLCCIGGCLNACMYGWITPTHVHCILSSVKLFAHVFE